jgi:hypothetical protein
MYEKTLDFARAAFDDIADADGNLLHRRVRPKMSDLSVISLAVLAESASISSENWLFSKLNNDYKEHFPDLLHRSRFNRRRRELCDQILEFNGYLAKRVDDGSKINLVDSMPCPVVKNSREKGFNICKENQETAPRKGYSAVDRRYFIGYKLHLISNEQGVFKDMQITPANVHDINYLKSLEEDGTLAGSKLVGDKGYISKQVQVDLFTNHNIELKVPYRRGQRQREPLDPELGKKRRRIETTFSQLCDQFSIKQNYAKSFLGFWTRIVSKLAAISLLQCINKEKGRPINHLKHAWLN